MFSKIRFWLECSRWYALPVSVFSWLIVFSFGLKNGGNPFFGLTALIGICFTHLGTNLFDDFIDYGKFAKNSMPDLSKGKCKYLFEGMTNRKTVLKVTILFFLISFFIGLFLCFAAGKYVLIFMIAGGAIPLLYPFLSRVGLSELTVLFTYGVLLFCGVYYVMTGDLSVKPAILSVPSSVFTVNLLYTDTFLDRKIDKQDNKITIAGLFKTEENALRFQACLIIFGYLSVISISGISGLKVLFTYLTIPFAFDLMYSLKQYRTNKNHVSAKNQCCNNAHPKQVSYMTCMYLARNLMIYFSLIFAISL